MNPRLPRSGERGQALALFVVSMFAIIGMVAIVIDVSWFWVNQQQMQRAADAGALAGAVYLPGDTTSAYSSARAEATKNGYTSGVNGVTVTPQQDPSNRRRLRVSINGQVDSYFARVFCAVSSSCVDQAAISVSGLAEFVLPVPMGSPQNYFGVGYLVDATGSTATPGNSRRSTGAVSSGSWNNPSYVTSNDNFYATASSNAASQDWSTFGFDTALPSSSSLAITGIQVRLADLFLTGSGTSTNCRVEAQLSWNGGGSWTTAQATTPALTTTTSADYDVGSTADTTAWGSHTWTRADLSDANFRVRLTWFDGTAACASTRSVSLDDLDVQVNYTTNTPSTSVTDVLSPTGGVLAPQNFWGAMNSQGAPSIQGDAYMTKYEVRSSTLNGVSSTDPDAHYAPSDYYNYGVEIPTGGSGELWIYDAGFCESGSAALGTGEFWTVGGANGYATRQPVSAFFDVYDSNDTPYEIGDDTLVASSNDEFVDMDFQDHDLVGTSATQPDCGSESWHHGWWKIADGLAGGKTYRLHTYSTDFSSPSDQDTATAHNAFAFWAASSSGTPRIYGIGAMEAYVRLPGGVASEFYLAQIEDEHAGKTMVIDLWDPGDTGALSASLQILKPTDADYVPVSFDYTAARGTGSTQASSCDSLRGSGVTSVTTNSGGSSLYNGCWLHITVQLASDYDAPHPATDTVTSDGGWWKIRYTMGGSTSSFSTDLTTWQVSMRGSPVHLVPDGS